MRRVIIIGLLMTIGATKNALAEIDSNYIDQGGVRYYIQTDKDVYNLGENVNILFRVSNLTDENISLGWVVGDPLAYYDFRVTKDDDWIWRYPYVSPVMGMTGIPFAPYESKEFQTSWNMMNYNGTLLETYDDFLASPGAYNVIGEVALWPVDERVPVSVSIDIVPEPASIILFGTGLISIFALNKQRQTK